MTLTQIEHRIPKRISFPVFLFVDRFLFGSPGGQLRHRGGDWRRDRGFWLRRFGRKRRVPADNPMDRFDWAGVHYTGIEGDPHIRRQFATALVTARHRVT